MLLALARYHSIPTKEYRAKKVKRRSRNPGKCYEDAQEARQWVSHV
jgi:hypothetical protein